MEQHTIVRVGTLAMSGAAHRGEGTDSWNWWSSAPEGAGTLEMGGAAHRSEGTTVGIGAGQEEGQGYWELTEQHTKKRILTLEMYRAAHRSQGTDRDHGLSELEEHTGERARTLGI